MSYQIPDWINDKPQPREYETVLEALEEKRVLMIEKEGEYFLLWEECDHYFNAKLTAEQLRALAAELIALSQRVT